MNYLVAAESFRLIDEEIKKIVGKNNYLVFNMNKCSVSDILEEASYMSLDEDKKYMVVSNASMFTTDGCAIKDESLEKYLDNPNPGTVIIFTTQGSLDMRKKITKMIKEKGKIINIPKADKRALNQILTNFMKEYDYNIDYKTVNYIMDNCYGSLDMMFNELEKIMLYYSFPCTVKYQDVKKIVGEELDSNSYHFVNAVIEKDLALSLKNLKSLKIYKIDSVKLIPLLAREYRYMYYIKKLYGKLNIGELMSKFNLQDWQINKFYNNSMKFTSDEILKNLVSLCDADANIKKGLWDKDIALYGFLLDACS